MKMTKQACWIAVTILVSGWAAVADTKPCTLEWAKEGAVTGPSYLWGLGISTNADLNAAQQEAKSKAFSDVTLQIRSSVQTNLNLSETDKATAFNGVTVVENKMDKINAVKVMKQGADASQNITACVVARLDVRDAYKIPEGQMQALVAKAAPIQDALSAKKFLDVLKLSSQMKTDIANAKDDIAVADTFKIFILSPGPTWNERFATLNGQIAQAEQAAKDNVVFVFPTGVYEDAFLDVESQLSGQGYSVVTKASDVASGKIPVSIEVKQQGTIRKTKTALGETAIANIMVSMRDGQSKQLLASNKGAKVIGTGQDDESAVANISRQLTAQVVRVISDGLPGLLKTDN